MSTSPEGLNALQAGVQGDALERENSADQPPLQGLLDGIRDQVEVALRPLGLKVEDLEQTIAQVRAASNATTNYVRTKPLQSLGIAAGVGLLLGVLARRR
jgi:ElaB/YqjD/DUF883 family membrane-anchored ribosome-binding protein